MTDMNAIATWAPTLLAVAARLAGMALVAPPLAHPAVPVKLRVGIAAAMALAVVARLAEPMPLPGSGGALVLGLGGELVLGWAIGYLAAALLAGVELGAYHVATQMGLALGSVANPTGGTARGSIAGLYHLLAVVAFFGVGGHRALIGGLLGSFRTVPPLGAAFGAELLPAAVGMLAAGFVLALKLAAPVLIALLLATVAMGLLQRAVPQISLLTVGLPVRALLGLAAIAAGAGAAWPLLDVAAGQLDRTVQGLIVAVR